MFAGRTSHFVGFVMLRLIIACLLVTDLLWVFILCYDNPYQNISNDEIDILFIA